MTAASITTPQLAPLQILITSKASGRKWRASFGGETLCVSASPLITSARILIAKGLDQTRIIEMWHDHADTWSLRGQLGAVAATRIDGETALCPAKNRALARFPGMLVTLIEIDLPKPCWARVMTAQRERLPNRHGGEAGVALDLVASANSGHAQEP